MKKSILTLAFLMFAGAIFAQEQAKRGPFLTNGFWDNWFISAGVGGNLYVGENDDQISLGDRISTAVDISLGKWFTPYSGLRFQYAGIDAKGYGPNALYADNNGNESFNVMNLHADYMLNLSNVIGGYKESRFWQFVPYVGAGWAKSWKKDVDPQYNEVGFASGLINKFRLSEAIDANLELRALYVNQRFEGTVGGRRGEGMASATVGLTYKFNRRDFTKYVEPVPCDYTPYTNKISDLEQKIANADAKAKQLASDLNAEKNKAPKVVTNTEYLSGKMSVWFQLGSSKISTVDMVNIGYYADMMKKSGQNYKIMGSADKETGNKKINQKLSEQRAKNVYDALVNKFGVNPSQLEIIAKGDTDEPYNKPVLNRVVVIE
ncbi:MAG: OmpA family protein [Bacteroidales bacterium]|nr:OmpA family protein [Bacteroidales bacterium]